MIQCSQCGASNSDEAMFCEKCGASLDANAAQTTSQSVHVVQAFPMAWHKFLIYFALWAGAVLNFIYGISITSGTQYGDSEWLVYATYPDLKTLDSFCGLALMVLAVMCIVTRFQLAGFKRIGPKLLMWMYGTGAVINLIYTVMFVYITKIDDMSLNSSVIRSIVVSIVMMVVNYTYYKKREALFVN